MICHILQLETRSRGHEAGMHTADERASTAWAVHQVTFKQHLHCQAHYTSSCNFMFSSCPSLQKHCFASAALLVKIDNSRPMKVGPCQIKAKLQRVKPLLWLFGSSFQECVLLKRLRTWDEALNSALIYEHASPPIFNLSICAWLESLT